MLQHPQQCMAVDMPHLICCRHISMTVCHEQCNQLLPAQCRRRVQWCAATRIGQPCCCDAQLGKQKPC